MQERVLLTGADGFLGTNITRKLIERGYEVLAFVEPSRSAKSIEGLKGVQIVKGDILKASDIEAAMDACDFVIHAAADTNVIPARSARQWRINYFGARNVLEAAQKNKKLKRLLLISSASSFGAGSRQNPGDETRPYNGKKYHLDYLDSKFAAMKAAQKAYKEAGLPVIILAPTFMFGPFDTKPGSGKMIVAQSMGKLPAYTSGGRNFVAVTDVATAVVNALTLGRLGECYILGGDNYSYREIFQIIDQVAHKRSRQLYVPGPLLRFFGHLASAIAKVRGKQPMLTAKMAWVASTDQFYSAEKARKEIGLPHTPIEVAVQDAYNWFSENGYLDRSA